MKSTSYCLSSLEKNLKTPIKNKIFFMSVAASSKKIEIITSLIKKWQMEKQKLSKKNNQEKAFPLQFMGWVICRLIKSTTHSLNGLKFALQNEFSFRSEVFLAGVALL